MKTLKENELRPSALEMTSRGEAETNSLVFYTVAHELTWDGKNFLDAENGESAEAVARDFSLMSYGDNQTVAKFASGLEAAAFGDQRFLDFLKSTMTGRGDIFITSSGTRYVPKSARLLAADMHRKLNVAFSQYDLKPVVLDQPMPLAWSDFVVSRLTVDESTPPLLASLRSGKYAGHPVIYVSDLFTSEAYARWIDKSLREIGQAENVFQLYALKLGAPPSDSVQDLTEILSNRLIDGSLPALKGVIARTENQVVQRTLAALFNPAHAEFLQEFLKTLPAEAVIKLYVAACQSDIETKNSPDFKRAQTALKADLSERGWLGSEGRLFLTQMIPEVKAASGEKITRLVTYTLNSKKDIPYSDAQLYSRMKYGDPRAVERVAQKMALTITSSDEWDYMKRSGDPIVLTSSAYGSVPTAAAIITEKVRDILAQQDVVIGTAKINRDGQFQVTNFGAMSARERAESLKKRRLNMTDTENAKLKGANVIVIDDLSATGGHERTTEEFLRKNTDAKKIAFAYFIKFGERLMVDEPGIEEWLNRAAVKTVKDLLPMWMRENIDLLGKPLSDKLQYMLPRLISDHGKKESAGWRIGTTSVVAWIYYYPGNKYFPDRFPPTNTLEIRVESGGLEQAIRDKVRVFVKDILIAEKNWTLEDHSEAEENDTLEIDVEVDTTKLSNIRLEYVPYIEEEEEA